MWQTIGHEWAIDLIERALASGHVAQANLLTGPAGIGKTHLAWALAAALNCQGEARPCGVCQACTLTARGQHPDVTLVEPDGARLKIDQVRGLQHTLALSPVMGRWRVAILPGFEAATREAANALLKTLEEPPARVVLILTAADAELLLPTVVSRCRVLALRPVPDATIARALQDRLGISSEQAQMLARVSGGRPGWALRAAQDPALLAARSQQLAGLEELLSANRLDRLDAAERLAKADDLDDLLALWQTWWRDVALIALGCGDLITNLDHREPLQRAAAGLTAAGAVQVERGLARARAQLLKNVNARLALDAALLQWPRVNARSS